MPVLIATPFATNGTKNDIPETTGAQPQNATMDEGFPAITQQPISTGGIPPERADFNGILYALSDNISHINKGLAYSFDATFATKIGGYPLHAELVMTDGTRVISTIANNMNNPDVDLTGWKKSTGFSSFRDVREWGVVPDQTTDYTALIRDIVQNQLGSYQVLYIPFGTRWNYAGIYTYLQDYQTIIDDSGRDEARNLWQSTRVTWHKTTANTGTTNGNTDTVSGDYHPAYVVDTYGTSGTAAARASTVYRLGGSSKWQTGMDATTAATHFSIAQYGSLVDGTKSFTIGHQDGTVAGRFGFNHALTTASMLYNFGKASYLDEATPFTVQFLQSSASTADFQQYFRYGTTTAYREDIKVDGTHSIVTKNSRRITTTADCVRYGTRKNVKAPTASILLTADESSSFITNIGSSVAFTASLPKAAIGLSFEFSVDAAFGLRVQPNVADNFVGMAASKYKESPTIGNKLKIVAVTANTWSFEQIGTWTDQA